MEPAPFQEGLWGTLGVKKWGEIMLSMFCQFILKKASGFGRAVWGWAFLQRGIGKSADTERRCSAL